MVSPFYLTRSLKGEVMVPYVFTMQNKANISLDCDCRIHTTSDSEDTQVLQEI